jgi:hypothetical protein
MARKQLFRLFAVATIATASATPLSAQAHAHPHLHIDPRWKECSIQIDAALDQTEWRQFTREAGLVAYFRPLTSAKPLGKGKFEISMLQYDTGIDDHEGAWNDTFVHPDSTHWLFEGQGLKFPGLTARAGLTDRTDLGVYFTRNPNANYGFLGLQLQHNFAQSADQSWNASARASAVKLFGPETVALTVYGADLVASKRFALTRWADLSPYVGLSSYLSSSHEKSDLVTLKDEHVLGAQAMAGVELRVSGARISAEYNASKVNSVSLKVGLGR